MTLVVINRIQERDMKIPSEEEADREVRSLMQRLANRRNTRWVLLAGIVGIAAAMVLAGWLGAVGAA